MDETAIIKKIKKTKYWHHDIEYIDGEFVEAIVKKYQDGDQLEAEILALEGRLTDIAQDVAAKPKGRAAQESKRISENLADIRAKLASRMGQTDTQNLIQKIIDNYSIFKRRWAKAFAPFLDGNIEDGELMHDGIIWRSARQFDASKIRKPNGKAFNAYLVSALMNQLKNLRNARMSHKNHPRVKCPCCGEEVYQIDDKHLAHAYDLERYRKKYPNYPISSMGGDAKCPVTGVSLENVDLAYVNRIIGRYTVDDFWKEFPTRRPKGPFRCPVTGTMVKSFGEDYFRGLLGDYSEEDFIRDFSDFEAIFECPFTGKKMLRMTQEYLDEVLRQDSQYRRYTQQAFDEEYPNVTMAAKQVPVLNPYTDKKVDEITPEMLAAAGTNVGEHLKKHVTIVLDKQYPDLVTCPFTGRRTYCIKSSDLDVLGKTTMEFYKAACKYPLRAFQVRCAICGDWVDNVWGHLAAAPHHFATSLSMEEFKRFYGDGATKITITNNSYVEGSNGDAIHISDLFVTEGGEDKEMEIEDSLCKTASDDLDRKIAKAVRLSKTFEDVCFLSADKHEIGLGFAFSRDKTREARAKVRDDLGTSDFDFSKNPEEGETTVVALVPSRQTIKDRLRKMVEASDLST